MNVLLSQNPSSDVLFVSYISVYRILLMYIIKYEFVIFLIDIDQNTTETKDKKQVEIHSRS